MELVLLTLTTLFVGYSAVAPEYRNNSLYTFNIDRDSSVIVMNTQTGLLHRCTAEFVCAPPLAKKVVEPEESSATGEGQGVRLRESKAEAPNSR